MNTFVVFGGKKDLVSYLFKNVQLEEYDRGKMGLKICGGRKEWGGRIWKEENPLKMNGGEMVATCVRMVRRVWKDALPQSCAKGVTT